MRRGNPNSLNECQGNRALTREPNKRITVCRQGLSSPCITAGPRVSHSISSSPVQTCGLTRMQHHHTTTRIIHNSFKDTGSHSPEPFKWDCKALTTQVWEVRLLEAGSPGMLQMQGQGPLQETMARTRKEEAWTQGMSVPTDE